MQRSPGVEADNRTDLPGSEDIVTGLATERDRVEYVHREHVHALLLLDDCASPSPQGIADDDTAYCQDEAEESAVEYVSAATEAAHATEVVGECCEWC